MRDRDRDTDRNGEQQRDQQRQRQRERETKRDSLVEGQSHKETHRERQSERERSRLRDRDYELLTSFEQLSPAVLIGPRQLWTNTVSFFFFLPKPVCFGFSHLYVRILMNTTFLIKGTFLHDNFLGVRGLCCVYVNISLHRNFCGWFV